MAFDIDAARRRYHASLREKAEQRSELAARAEQDARAIVTMLIADYQPRRIYRWGSLLRPDGFREWSDIDVAVEGLGDPLAGLRAADDAQRLTTFPVDLVELDRIDPRHAATIRDEGVLVYEAAPTC